MEKFEALRAAEKEYFTDMVRRCKDSGATLVICQWGFDDEANHLLMAASLPGALPVHSCCLSLASHGRSAQHTAWWWSADVAQAHPRLCNLLLCASRLRATI